MLVQVVLCFSVPTGTTPRTLVPSVGAVAARIVQQLLRPAAHSREAFVFICRGRAPCPSRMLLLPLW